MDHRIRKLNEGESRADARYVLYWMRWNRRAEANHALHFAIELANGLELPVLALETLGCDYPYASDRLHMFALEGVPETAASLKSLGVGYAFHLQQRRGQRDSVFRELTDGAAIIVTDDHPLNGASLQASQPVYAVDSSCVTPMSVIERRCYAAYSIRPKIHKVLPAFLKPLPQSRPRIPFRGPAPIAHTDVQLSNIPKLVASSAIDHTVAPTTAFRGGRSEAERLLARFLEDRLRRYAREKNEPAAHATSELSPYLRSGCISSLEVALAVREHASRERLQDGEFLEELIVRRELAFNFARYAGAVDSYGELPQWARDTLEAHRDDARSPVYTRERFERAETHDDLWNAAQKELLFRGKIHGYYRMYWGKKVLEWSAAPEEALSTMIYLNDRYALDGQDPNSYANILWCLGLHDRPWPERPVFGTVRSMSRAGMDRKTNVPAYIREIEYLERTGKEFVR